MQSTTMTNTNVSLTLSVVYICCLGDEEWRVRDEYGSNTTQFGGLSQIVNMYQESVVVPIDPFTAHQEGMINWSEMQVSEAMRAWFNLLTEGKKDDG